MPNMSRVLFVGILVVGFVVLFAACKDLEKREQVTTRSGVREETAVKEAETTAEQEGPADTGADTLPPVETLTLWPSDLCDVKPTGGGSVEVDADRIVHVVTGASKSNPWTGASVFFKAGEMDLAEYGPLRVTVSNAAERALTIQLGVRNRNQKGSSPHNCTRLAPGAVGVIKINLRKIPWVLDRPLELVGMQDYPAAFEGGSFNVRKTASLHIFLYAPETPTHFAILRAEVDKVPLTFLKADTFLPFVDRFGQFIHDDWPGKIHDEAELQQAKEREAAWLAANAEGPTKNRNAWGGWTAGPQLKATGHFRTEKIDGMWWLVDPVGRLFFSHGVDCVTVTYGGDAMTPITHRENYFAWLPEKGAPFEAFYAKDTSSSGFYKDKGTFQTFNFAGANLLRKYGETWADQYADLAHRRLRAWGLNTMGSWSDTRLSCQRRTPYTVSLGSGGPRIHGTGIPDPFAPEFGGKILRQRTSHSDPWCIGYFVDNEPPWGQNDRAMALATLRSPATQPVKIAFRDWLAGRYATVTALNAAWGTTFDTWDAFLASTNSPPSGQSSDADLEAFNTQIAEQYFRVIRETLKAVAPDKLYLGCRLLRDTSVRVPGVFRAAAKYCDVVGINCYGRQVGEDLPEGSEDKPMINGEFHFGALDRGGFHAGVFSARNQAERAACYVAYVESFLRHPRYVGTHWFQWRDQALTGRIAGAENYQCGFLTVTDQPYPELVEAVRKIGATMYATRTRFSTNRKTAAP
jgi:hypothetical protein